MKRIKDWFFEHYCIFLGIVNFIKRYKARLRAQEALDSKYEGIHTKRITEAPETLDFLIAFWEEQAAGLTDYALNRGEIQTIIKLLKELSLRREVSQQKE